MKQRKIAISLAVVAAIAAPFVSRAYKAQPVSKTWVPLTAEAKANIAAALGNCPTAEDHLNKLRELGVKPSFEDISPVVLCDMERGELRDGGEYKTQLSAPKYLALNTAAAVAGFVLVFGLTFL